MSEEKKKVKEKKKVEDITFFHPDIFEVPENEPCYLKGYECLSCGKKWFPKFDPCPECLGEEFKMIKLSRQGELYSYTVMYIVTPEMRKYAPLAAGYVDLPEKIRVFAQLDGDPESFEVGETVELTSGPVKDNRDGKPIISYKFKKVA